jgi:type IV pilus assembly protein PilC
LDEVLQYLADQLEKDYELNSKIKGALIYPAFIISAMAVLGVVMMIFVVPQLTQMLVQTGAALPFSTRALIAVSTTMQHFWWLLLLMVIGLVVTFRWWVTTAAGKAVIDRVLLRLPVFGRLLSYIYIVRFSRGLRTLLEGGVPLVDSLDVVSNVPGNVVYRDYILATKAAVSEGHSISTVFSREKKIPPMVGQMLATGEQTGQIIPMLDTISTFYGREVTNTVDNLVALMEPAIMVLLGIAVGIMVAAIILPMYQISANL